MSLPLKRWQVEPRVQAGTLHGFPEVVQQLLYNRGISDLDSARAFFRDDDALIPDPFRMKGIERAVERIARAVARRELAAIYGDFDVDGITASALLHDVLKSLGARTITYIPNRSSEGYGLNKAAIERLAEQGASLLITVDCGISASAEVAYARSLGIDVVITDHHQVPSSVPDAVAVINPRQPDCAYPYKELAGVGVAFKLAQALLARLPLRDRRSPRDVLEAVLDLVALGTVADVAPLLGENRLLVKRGLKALNKTSRLGLRQLMRVAGLPLGKVTAHSISYILGPRLNSAGRLQDASTSYRLLVTHSEEEAGQLAGELEATNQERQRLTVEALNRAREEIYAGGQVPKLLIIAGTEYPSGIVGLVAGKLMEEFYRPALVVELGDEESRGSARSIAELDITEVLAACDDLLSRYGGHAMAAGFTIPSVNLSAFKDRLIALINDRFDGVDLQPSLHVDRELLFGEISWDLCRWLRRMEPFGYGNPMPVFVTRGVLVSEARAVGKDLAHLRARLTDGRRYWTAIGFKLGVLAEELRQRRVDVAYNIVASEWNGQVSLELEIKDLQPLD